MTRQITGEKPQRDGGKFAKGSSGNPAGRPKSESADLRRKLTEHGDAVVDVVLAAAKSGDLVACRLVLERLLPALKSTAAPVVMAMPDDAGLSDTGRAILAAITDGDLAPDVGSRLLAAVGSLARIIEICLGFEVETLADQPGSEGMRELHAVLAETRTEDANSAA